MAGASVLVAIAVVVAAAFAGPSEAVAVEPGVAAGGTDHSLGNEEEGEAS